MKYIEKVLIFGFLFISITAHSQDIKWFPFKWYTDSILGKYYDKLAIIIPVTVDELPHKFSMQLDLGAVETEFNGNEIAPYLDKYISLKNKLDTTKKYWKSGGKQYPMFSSINLMLGNTVFKNLDIGYFSDFGDKIPSDSIYSETEKHIGTIAPDIFQNRILIIDYKLNRLTVTDKLPTEYTDASFEKAELKNGRIKIPFLINKKTEWLLFDTGAMFALTTSRSNALKISASEVVDSLTAHSWGESIMFYGLNVNAPIWFGKEKIKNSVVYYDKNGHFDNFYKSENIWGVTGNAYFLNHVVIIDYKNNLFGIK